MENVIESAADKTTERPAHLFTKQNASQMGKRAQEAMRKRKEEQRRIAELGALNEAEYCREQVTRVRGHIERLHRKIETCPNAKDLQALSQALKNITELETKLRTPAGQPKTSPGSSKSSTVSPIE